LIRVHLFSDFPWSVRNDRFVTGQFDSHIIAALIAHNHIGLAVVLLSVEEHASPVAAALTGVVVFSHAIPQPLFVWP
jgi:hypothetical protein